MGRLKQLQNLWNAPEAFGAMEVELMASQHEIFFPRPCGWGSRHVVWVRQRSIFRETERSLWTGGIIPTFSICSADEFALMEEQVWTERTSDDIAQKRLPAVALTRLIFGTDALCALGKKIALLADMPLECSE